MTDGTNSTGSTLSITVENINDAPVVDAAVEVVVRVEEDDFDNTGARVEDVDDAISDVDAGALVGIAIIAVDDVDGGAFEFSLDGGATFEPVGAVSEASALRLAGGNQTRLRLVPPPGSNESFNVTYVAWDQTDGGGSGSRADVSGARGSDTAFSSATGVIEFNIDPVNDAPVFTTPPPNPVVADEGEELIVSIPVFDEDGPELAVRLEGSTLPASAVVDLGTPINGSAAGTVTVTLTWTPLFSDAGDYTFTLVADDSLLEASLVVNVRAVAIDVDGDGVPDTVEALIGTSPGSNDSDGDTISDLEELGPDPQNPPDSDDDGIIDAFDDDSDGDGVPDSV